MIRAFLPIFATDIDWIQKHQHQLKRFMTTPFLEGIISHLRNLDLLTMAEEAQIKAASQLQDQVDMLTNVLTSKDPKGPDALRGFIESSGSQVSQFIIKYGKELVIGFLIQLTL